jgi:hypothetical protein
MLDDWWEKKGAEAMYSRNLSVFLAMVFILALTAMPAWAAPVAQGEKDITANALWGALVPLLAIATAIERLLERFWERWEVKGAWPNSKGVPRQERESRVYKESKKARGHWLGFGLAILAIALTNVRLFHQLGLDVLFSASTALFDLGIGGILDDFTLGTLVDWLGTAFVIGWGGTELTHSVITSLVRGRGLWKEMREVQQGQKSILQVEFFKDEIAPALEELGISVTALRQVLKALSAAGVSVDELIAQMTIGKAQEFLSEVDNDAARAMLTLLEGVPEAEKPDAVQIGWLLDWLAPESRQRFLGA